MIRDPAPETGENPGSLPDAGPAQGRGPVAVQAMDGAKGGSLFLMLFIASLFIPGSFSVGPIGLTFYKLFLLASAVPLGLHWIQGRAGGIVAPDILVLAFCIWQALSILANNGMSQIIIIGTNTLEVAGGYLAGRVLVRCAADYRAFFRYFLTGLLVLLPFVLVEFLTGRRLLKHLLGVVLDTETGALRVTRLVNVADVGTPINPKIVETQLSGGALMQLGFTLFEKMQFDGGQVTNASLADYKIPGIHDVPAAMENEAVEAYQSNGPFGAKGVGELATFGVSPAIANAIEDAVGVRLTELPLIAESLFRALRAKDGKPLGDE